MHYRHCLPCLRWDIMHCRLRLPSLPAWGHHALYIAYLACVGAPCNVDFTYHACQRGGTMHYTHCLPCLRGDIICSKLCFTILASMGYANCMGYTNCLPFLRWAPCVIHSAYLACMRAPDVLYSLITLPAWGHHVLYTLLTLPAWGTMCCKLGLPSLPAWGHHALYTLLTLSLWGRHLL